MRDLKYVQDDGDLVYVGLGAVSVSLVTETFDVLAQLSATHMQEAGQEHAVVLRYSNDAAKICYYQDKEVCVVEGFGSEMRVKEQHEQMERNFDPLFRHFVKLSR
mmetsp:Transcript_50765/g.114121  ORF Transcript_50765/g.114121 Transcript_50765/m.114121 type:complete len:105 (-) Transcript_50765:248-562(-)